MLAYVLTKYLFITLLIPSCMCDAANKSEQCCHSQVKNATGSVGLLGPASFTATMWMLCVSAQPTGAKVQEALVLLHWRPWLLVTRYTMAPQVWISGCQETFSPAQLACRSTETEKGPGVAGPAYGQENNDNIWNMLNLNVEYGGSFVFICLLTMTSVKST